MLEIFWARFSFIIAVPIHLLALKLWRTLCICRMAQRQVSISASTTLHSAFKRTTPLVSVEPFEIRISIFHPKSLGI